MEGISTKLIGDVILANDDHLSMRLREMRHRQSVGGSEHSVLLRAPGKDFQSLFGLLAIGRFVGIGVQTQQSNCRGWIAGRRGRILKRFPPRAQNAERILLFTGTTGFRTRNVEEASRT